MDQKRNAPLALSVSNFTYIERILNACNGPTLPFEIISVKSMFRHYLWLLVKMKHRTKKLDLYLLIYRKY